jgi:MOSC domain-containing protein YiiM
MGVLEHIFISAASFEPAISLDSVEAITECGLAGDRYAKPENRSHPDRQATFIDAAHIEAFVREIGLPLEPAQSRRNLVTRGIDLNQLVGQRFQVGEVEFEGVELCDPCSRWADNTHAKVVSYFVHKGGLRARIVRGGKLRVGDALEKKN